MQSPESTPASSGLGFTDIYLIVFKHKWKIVLCSLAGVLVSMFWFLSQTPLYESDAKLLVRYIVENKSVTPGDDPQTKSPTSSAETIINSELEILGSFDLALDVVDKIGAEKILAKLGGGTNRIKAAALIMKNLATDVPRRSNIIRIALKHPDPDLVRPILAELVDAYLKKHMEVHRAVGIFDDFLSQQTDQLRSRLAQTEDELRKLKTKAGVISFDDAKKGLTVEISKIREELFNTESQLAERQAALVEMEKLVPVRSETNSVQFGAPVPKINEYKSLNARLDTLLRRQDELRSIFTEENSMVQGVNAAIATAQAQKEALEKEFPKLVTLSLAAPLDAAQRPDPRLERAKVTALEAKLKMLNTQLEKVRAEAVGVDDISITVAQLERKKQIEETNYRYYSASLDQARVDETLGVGRMSNINKVQAPSPPLRDRSKIKKTMLTILAGGVLGGLAIAFLIELVLDQTVKRPAEIENNMGLPVYLTVPEITPLSGRFRQRLWNKLQKKLSPGSADAAPNGAVNGKGNPATGVLQDEIFGPEGPLRAYYEALRDRVVMFFEASKITRKPKLIGVTSCSKGSGVTTIAAGLAASLSNTGDGKVLLIDLNLNHGGIHPFFEGAPVCGLLDILDKGDRGTTVRDNLDVVSASGANGSAVSVRSKQFTDLMPRLKASNYDYIVFDLPPINQTSATMRLAGFMDKVLLVVEAGKTHRSVVKRSLSYLAASNPNLAGILNKTPCVAPSWLNPEI